MSANWMIIACLLVSSIALACARPDAGEGHYSRPELAKAFRSLEVYLNAHEDVDEAGLAKLAKSVTVRVLGSGYFRRALRILNHLNKADKCSPETLDNMWYVFLGRPNSEPGWQVTDGWNKEKVEKHRLDKLLEAAIIRASQRCKSFLNTWHDQSEQTIDPEAKRKLYNLFPMEALVRSRREGKDNTVGMIAGAVRRDPVVGQQVARSRFYDQLLEIVFAYMEDNYVPACKKYLEAMSGVITRASRLGIPYSRHTDLFEQPSEAFLNSQGRSHACSAIDLSSENHLKDLVKQVVDSLSERNTDEQLKHL